MMGLIRQGIVAGSTLLAFAVACGPEIGLAQSVLPQAPNVVSGGVSIGAPSGSSLTITQTTPRAIVNWQSFSIGQPNVVTFQQPGSRAAILNRVTSNTTSMIAGRLNANGQVFLVNPNGIVITSTGSVKTGGGFVASTLDIRNEDFMGGRLDFLGSGSSGHVGNTGRIEVGSGGFAALLGGSVSNAGSISVPLGRVALGSGERATLDLSGDGFLQIAMPTGSGFGRALVDSSGRIFARGGRVELRAATVREMVRQAVNMSGVVAARSVQSRNGVVVLDGGAGGGVRVAGKVTVAGRKGAGQISVAGHSVEVKEAQISARSKAGQGGSVTIAASEVAIDRATFDVSGATGGGAIRVDTVHQANGGHADKVIVGADARFIADATDKGNGGTVVIWSESLTEFKGSISAKGGINGGDGGFAEVSSNGLLSYQGLADLSATHGAFGTLLLDPYNMTISNAGDANHSGFTATGDDSVISVATLEAALAGAHVTVSTGVGGGQSGDITVASAITWNADTTLTLQAARNILVNADITANGNTAGLVLTPGGSGSYTLAQGAKITFNGSNPSLSIAGQAYTLIRDVNELQAAMPSNLSGRYALATDIDASLTAGWNHNGSIFQGFNPVSTFQGTFDGLGHTISALVINRPAQSSVGLFGTTNSATVRNVGLAGGSIFGNQSVGSLIGSALGTTTVDRSFAAGVTVTGGGNLVGGLLGYSGGRITSSYATGPVFGVDQVGGLIGFGDVSSTITSSYATGDVTGTGSKIGGLAGFLNISASVQSSYASGAVRGLDWVGGLIGDATSNNSVQNSYAIGSATGRHGVGGLIGNTHLATVQNSYATGHVTGTGRYAGGLIGYNNFGTVRGSHAEGRVDGGVSEVGGLIGFAQSAIVEDNYAAGSVFGTGQVGGLIGYITSSSSRVERNYATGSVTGSGIMVGGLIGLMELTTVQSTYATGSVTGQQYVGGLIGYSTLGALRMSYATGHVSGVSHVGGVNGFNHLMSVSNVYWDTDTSATLTGIGAGSGSPFGLTTAQLQGTAALPVGVTFNLGVDFSGGAAGTPTGIYPYLVVFGPPIPNLITLTFTSHSASKVYGNTIDLTGLYDVTASSGVVPSLTGTLLISSAGADQTAGVGSYAVNVAQGSLVVPSGYEFQFVSTGLLTVSQRPITVTADAQSKVYGNADPALTYQVTSGTLVGADMLGGGLVRIAGENVGAYSIAQGSLSNANYVITYVGANLTVNQRSITVTADAKSKVYGNADPVLTYQITSGNLVVGDSLSGSLTRNAGENVGSYAINQGSLNNSNYAIGYVGANLTIGQRPITVTADAKSKIYGNADPALTYQITSGNLVAADAFSGGLTRTAGENVGVYAIAQGSLSNANYAVGYVGANLTIGQRPITVTADAKNKVYGNADPALTYQITSGNLVGTDVLSGSLTRNAGENVGSHAINQGSLNNSNYAIGYVGANLAITPAGLMLAANNATKTFGLTMTFVGTEFVAAGLLGTDAVTSVTLASLGAPSLAPIGVYAINAAAAQGIGVGNYTITYVPGTLIVSAAPTHTLPSQLTPSLIISFGFGQPMPGQWIFGGQGTSVQPEEIAGALLQQGQAVLFDCLGAGCWAR